MKRLDTTSPSPHDRHDPSLVAAYAAGDAAGPELAAASALVADCAGCAALHRDLRAIAAALPAVPARPRTRDFRITAEQAAALRPAGARGALARLLAPLASARFAFAGPAGAGLAALGIAGILLSGGFGGFGGIGGQVMPATVSAPVESSGSGGAPSTGAVPTFGASTPAFAMPSPAPTTDGATGVVGQAAPMGSERTNTTNQTHSDASPVAMVPGASAAAGPKQAVATDAALLATPNAVIAPAPTAELAAGAPPVLAPHTTPAVPAGIPPVALAGLLLLVAGLLMGGLRVLARRLA